MRCIHRNNTELNFDTLQVAQQERKGDTNSNGVLLSLLLAIILEKY
ncbi:MAG: hypothetical protein ACI90V_005310, partial [Bacillariaceae sp.]